jgi:hypothetical protein
MPKRSLYDCYHAKVQEDEIHCEQGNLLAPKTAGISIQRLVRGEPLELAICQSCLRFAPMDGGKVLPENRGWLKLNERKG